LNFLQILWTRILNGLHVDGSCEAYKNNRRVILCWDHDIFVDIY
jgi:hypothetical protein